MHKLLLSVLLGSSLSFAGMINAIALTVNDEPVTLYDIDKTMVTNKISKNKAVGILVDKILYEQLVKKYGITADIFDVNAYVEKLAANNGMDEYSFKSIIKQRYPDYSVFEEESKKVIIRQKLLKKIIKGQLKIANDEDLELYYENNQDKFITAQNVEVIQYTSQNKASLYNNLKSPLLNNKDVQKQNISLEMNRLSPQMQYLLNSTKEKSFTPIFTSNKMFTSLFVSKKIGKSTLSYETVKAKIFNDIMSEREKKYLKEYFEKEKLTAEIKVIR